jgi:hypothetical protein
MSSKVFSQKAIVEKKGDTIICFTIPQAKFLLKEQYRLQMNDSLLSVCEVQKKECDSIRLITNRLIDKYEQSINLCMQYQGIQEIQIKGLNETIENQQKVIRREKRGKIVAIIGGSILSGFLGYLLVVGN